MREHKTSLKGQCHEFFECWFFHQIAPPGPTRGTLGQFRFWPNILGGIQQKVSSSVYDTLRNGNSTVYHTQWNGDYAVCLTPLNGDSKVCLTPQSRHSLV